MMQECEQSREAVRHPCLPASSEKRRHQIIKRTAWEYSLRQHTSAVEQTSSFWETYSQLGGKGSQRISQLGRPKLLSSATVPCRQPRRLYFLSGIAGDAKGLICKQTACAQFSTTYPTTLGGTTSTFPMNHNPNIYMHRALFLLLKELMQTS